MTAEQVLEVAVSRDAYDYFESVARQEATRKQVTGSPGFPLDHPLLEVVWRTFEAIKANTDYTTVVVVPSP